MHWEPLALEGLVHCSLASCLRILEQRLKPKQRPDLQGNMRREPLSLCMAKLGLHCADKGLRGSSFVDKQGNLIPDAHYIFSALPDSSLSAEGAPLLI